MIKKCLIWGIGQVFFDTISAIKYHELRNNLEVIGFTSKIDIYKEFYGYKYIPENDIQPHNTDFILALADNNDYKYITEKALSLGFKQDQIISPKVIKHPSFDINKYSNILKHKPTIFVNNCWAGITYNSLGLQFNSPFINMFISDRDYINFLKDPHTYIDSPIEFLRWEEVSQPSEITRFPTAKCKDISLRFNHYKTFENAQDCWERRKKRINWNNLLVVMCTENKDMEKAFNQLPYEKKICFVPYKSNEESSIYIPLTEKEEFKNIPFGRIMNNIAFTDRIGAYYDVFDILESGKINEVVKIN